MNYIPRILYSSKVLRCHNLINRQCVLNAAFPSKKIIVNHYTTTNEVRPLYQPETLKQKLLNKLPFFNISRTRLKVTGFLLYETIADHINYPDMFRKLNLPDTFYSWFVITELHIWMLMVRYMAEGEDGRIVRNHIIAALWTDCNHRAKKLGAANPSGVKMQIAELSEQLNAALISYDEGLQSDDMVLAGSLWRRLYQQEHVDPEHLDALVKYVRRQIKLLDNLSKYELFEERTVKWEPFQL